MHQLVPYSKIDPPNSDDFTSEYFLHKMCPFYCNMDTSSIQPGIDTLDSDFFNSFLKMTKKFEFNPELLFAEEIQKAPLVIHDDFTFDFRPPTINHKIGTDSIVYGGHGVGKSSLIVESAFKKLKIGESSLIVLPHKTDIDHISTLFKRFRNVSYLKWNSNGSDGHGLLQMMKKSLLGFLENATEEELKGLPNNHLGAIVGYLLARHPKLKDNETIKRTMETNAEYFKQVNLVKVPYETALQLFFEYCRPPIIIVDILTFVSTMWTSAIFYYTNQYENLYFDDFNDPIFNHSTSTSIMMRHAAVSYFGSMNWDIYEQNTNQMFIELSFDRHVRKWEMYGMNWRQPLDIVHTITFTAPKTTIETAKNMPMAYADLPFLPMPALENSSIKWIKTPQTSEFCELEITLFKRVFKDLMGLSIKREECGVFFMMSQDNVAQSHGWIMDKLRGYPIVMNATGRHYEYVFILATKTGPQYDATMLNFIFGKVRRMVFVFGNREWLNTFPCWKPWISISHFVWSV